MTRSKSAALLSDPQVRDEIDRYKWIESEKEGQDIGFDAAAKNWLRLYAKAWEVYHGVGARKPGRSVRKHLFEIK